MIDTLFFALQIIGIVVILAWAVIHDRRSEGSASGGPLAFKQPVDPLADHAGRGREPRHRRFATRPKAGSHS